MTKKRRTWSWSIRLGVPLALIGLARFQGLGKSLAVRLLAQSLDNPAKRRGLEVDLGPGIPGWLKVSLVGFMSRTLPDIVGYPVEAVAFSRFGGFNRDPRYADFQNPHSPSYQAWYGAYLVFDNEHQQRFGFNADGSADPQAALDALEADQRLVYQNAGIPHTFADGRLVRLCGPFQDSVVEEDGLTWHRLTGAAETWSTYHRGQLPAGSSKFGWCYGAVPPTERHGLDDLHPLTYRGEFWVRYEPDWQASCSKFFIYPSFTDQQGRQIDKGSAWLVKAGQAALAGIRFKQNKKRT